MNAAFSFSLFFVALAVSVGWAIVLARTARAIRAVRRLPLCADDGTHGPLPKVSAVIAARNESGLIERAVASLLHQEAVDIQVIVVDDNSEDDTFERVRQMAERDKRLLVLRNEKLPRGWVAKNYALELGQGRADGDYILFSDADVIHGRRAVCSAVRIMQQEKLDHLALHPRLEASTFIEALVLPLHFLLAEFRFVDPRATDPASGIGAGVGAFNLVRADSYRLRGTHARIRGAVLDDRALGRMMRDDGGRGTLMRAVGQVRMRPYRSLRDLYVGIKKGVLSSFGNSAIIALVMGLLLLFAALTPPVLLLSSIPIFYAGHIPWVAIPAFAALVLPVGGLLQARSMVKFEPLAALFFPVGALVMSAAAIHAALVFGAKGTVEWRGREYSRADLREMGY